MRSLLCLSFALLLPTFGVAQVAKSFRYPEAVHKTGQVQGELKYVKGIPFSSSKAPPRRWASRPAHSR
jgi:hypothetical protein